MNQQKQQRPSCFDSAMSNIGLHEETIRNYIERIERALEYISTAETGGELFPVGPTRTDYSEDGNTVIAHHGPWRFLYGLGDTFLESVEDDIRQAETVPQIHEELGKQRVKIPES